MRRSALASWGGSAPDVSVCNKGVSTFVHPPRKAFPILWMRIRPCCTCLRRATTRALQVSPEYLDSPGALIPR